MNKKLLYFSAGAVFLLDRLLKICWGDKHFTLIPHILAVNGTHNTGMAFGLFAGQTLPLILITLLVLTGLFLYLRSHPLHTLEQFSLGLTIGGALGNLFDRVAYGYVIDMLEPLFIHFFIFNIADAGITVGAVLLGAAILFGKEDTKDGNA